MEKREECNKGMKKMCVAMGERRVNWAVHKWRGIV